MNGDLPEKCNGTNKSCDWPKESPTNNDTKSFDDATLSNSYSEDSDEGSKDDLKTYDNQDDSDNDKENSSTASSEYDYNGDVEQSEEDSEAESEPEFSNDIERKCDIRHNKNSEFNERKDQHVELVEDVRSVTVGKLTSPDKSVTEESEKESELSEQYPGEVFNSSSSDGYVSIRYDTSNSSPTLSSNTDSSSESDAECNSDPSENLSSSSLTDLSSFISSFSNPDPFSATNIQLPELVGFENRTPTAKRHFRSLSDCTGSHSRCCLFPGQDASQEKGIFQHCGNRTSTPIYCHVPRDENFQRRNQDFLNNWRNELGFTTQPHLVDSDCYLHAISQMWKEFGSQPTQVRNCLLHFPPGSDLTFKPWHSEVFASEDEEAVYYLITKYLNNS